MQAPEVSVIVREVHSFKASIVGQVKAPGRYDLKGRTTVLDLLATAGPVRDFAAPRAVLFLWTNGPRGVAVPLHYKKSLSRGARSGQFRRETRRARAAPHL